MNYLSFFELNQEPFSNAPVSRFYYGSQQHGRALVRLMHAIESMKGLAVLVGEIGAGKTTTARRLLESLPEDQYEAALLVMVQSGVSPQWLITKIAYQLGVSNPSEDKTRLLGQLYRRLYAIHESGRKAVVLVDEAQMLNTRELMEEVRGLLNMEIPDQKLLTILFFGLPDLEEHLKLDPPLYQRIGVRARLEPLSPEATEAYIKHRLKLAGATRMLFTQEAVQAVHRASSGIPRLINTICDNGLFEGFLSRTNPITARIIDGVVAELGYDGVTERGGYKNAPEVAFAGYGTESTTRGRSGRTDASPTANTVKETVAHDPAFGGKEPARVEPGGRPAEVEAGQSAGRRESGGKREGAEGARGLEDAMSNRGVSDPRRTGQNARVTPGSRAGAPDRSDEINSILAALEEK